MHCFCYNKIFTEKDPYALSLTWQDIHSESTAPFCKEWLENYVLKETVKQAQSLSVIVINLVATAIFEVLGKFQKFYTKNEETVSIMSFILWLQFINFAIVPLITKFSFEFAFLNKLNLFAGPYADFTPQWY